MKRKYNYQFLWNVYCAQGTLWQTVETPELQINFFVSNRNSDISTFGCGSHSVQKAVDFSTPAKNRIKKALENQNVRSKCW